MYFRVIRNRGHKKINKKKIKTILICVIAIYFTVYAAFVIGDKKVKVLNIENKVLGLVETVIYNGYKFVLCEKYSLISYEKSNDNQWELTDIVNYNSNLYVYMEQKSEIQVVCVDPLYNYQVNSMEETSIEEPKKEELNIEVANGKETENMEGDNTNSVDGKEEVDKVVDVLPGLEGYIRPKPSPDGMRYTMTQLTDFEFLMNKLYIVPARAKVIEEELDGEEMLKKDMALVQDNSKPQILIYHTHSQEGFVDSVKGQPETYIVGVGEYLAKILSEEYGYNVIHCKEQFDIRDGKLDRSKAYTYAEEKITQILQDNPSIEVVLDIHRDGLKEGAEKLVTTIDGKQVAKIMYFNGVSRSSANGDIEYLYNRYKKDNLAFSFQLKLASMECFPEFTRKNYIDAYQYNQHLRGKSVLIEVGAQNNTLQEELNAMEVFAEILHRVIK